ncbi:MAG: tail completion protein gp17 [Actinomycetota bacterium]
MSLRLLPDCETVCVDYLKSVGEVAALVGNRVAGQLPPKAVFPYLTVSSSGGPPVIEFHLTAALIQIDAWAPNRLIARTLARTAAAALVEMPGVRGDAVVTGIQTFVGIQKIKDPTLAHYSFSVRVFAHPKP